jgi:hypothetical protein
LAAAGLLVGVLAVASEASLPSVAQAAQLTLRPATQAAPAESPTRPAQLTRSIDGIAFPDLAYRFGWRTVGTRNDTLSGRNTATVFYLGPSGQRIGYEIVAGTALATPQGHATKRDGTTYRVLNAAGLRLVTWERAGNTCILAGRRATTRTLLMLARWSNA